MIMGFCHNSVKARELYEIEDTIFGIKLNLCLKCAREKLVLKGFRFVDQLHSKNSKRLIREINEYRNRKEWIHC